jgi:hypothetical protein
VIDQLIDSPTTPKGVLEPEALRRLVDAVMARPELWDDRVRHDPDARHFELLWRDERIEVWVICWTGEGHDTGFHDHDVSNGAFGVARGDLVEERLAIGNTIRRRLRAGQSVSFGTSHVHRVHGVEGGESVSVHAYSPPLRRMGVYGVSDEGALERESVAPTHELRSTPAAVDA